jgi:hypothetical protein
MSLTNQSNLPTIQRLKYEDFADAGSWQKAIELLVNALNLFLTPVYNILNGGVGYSNLVVPQIFSKTIVAGTTTTFTFQNPLSIAPSSVMLGNVWSGVPSIHPAAVCQVMWHVTNGNKTIVVDNVIGLSSGTQYVLTLVVQ